MDRKVNVGGTGEHLESGHRPKLRIQDDQQSSHKTLMVHGRRRRHDVFAIQQLVAHTVFRQRE